MNSRGRYMPSRRNEPSGPKFCSRCGGPLSAQGALNPTNVCRCTKAQREQHGRPDDAGAEEVTAQ
jgi:hypothetical protein